MLYYIGGKGKVDYPVKEDDMPREIKFRAWDTLKKEMYEVMSVDFEVDAWFNENEGHHHSENGRVIIMQYTGLKDKNGKEIYEGDVLRLGGIGNVAIKYGCFVIGNDDWGVEHKTMGFAGEWIDEPDSYTMLTEEDKFEVIGNIYENPELIKEE